MKRSFEISSSHHDSTKKMKDFQLSDEQKDILSLAADGGRNVLLLGGAGTGKSTLVSHLVKRLLEKRARFRVTSMTGASALIIGGSTLHSTLGIKTGKNDDFRALLREKKVDWTLFDVLVIDEISMMDGIMFDRIDTVARILRNCPDKPFGGIQIVAVGDFHQLPPVNIDKYMFESKAYREGGFVKRTLRIMQRAKSDERLMEIMERFRLGTVTASDVALLNAKNEAISLEDCTIPHLYAKRLEAAKYNERCMTAIGKRIYAFNGIDHSVDLCVGCRVMSIVNQPLIGIANGSLGTVARFDIVEGERIPVVEFDEVGEARVFWYQRQVAEGQRAMPCFMPLQLAYGITIHKAQGSTFPKVVVFADGIFCAGQAMTALSRSNTLDGIQVIGLQLRHIMYNTTCRLFQESPDSQLVQA